MNYFIYSLKETEDNVESQHLDESNPQREEVSKENDEPTCLNPEGEEIREPKLCKNIREFFRVKNKKSIMTASLITLTLNLAIYFGLFGELSKLTRPAQTVTVSSEGPAAEMYPDSMGQYNLLRGVYRYDRAVYKHVDREDRFIIFTGRNTSL